jgi:hypothetical protein
VAVDAFLLENPEMKDLLEGMSLYDVAQVDEISKNVRRRITERRNYWLQGAVAAIIIVLISSVIWYNTNNNTEIVETSVPAEEPAKKDVPLIVEPINEEVQIAEAIMELDTFYTVEKKGKEVKLNVESTSLIVTNFHEKETIQDNNSVQNNIKEPADKIISKPIQENKKSFNFIVSLDYRQSVEVESAFASGNKVGATNAFAGPVAGYAYNDEGMPYFGQSDEDFYDFLQEKLENDSTLDGISKKMQARVSFEVNNKGKVTDVRIMNCNHKQLCLSLSTLFENIPDWNPAENKGKKGRVHYVIQVQYSK